MKGVIVTEPNRVEIQELEKPKPGPYQALVKTDICAVCNSTDTKVVAGHFPGLSNYPLVLGHEATGIVEAVGTKVRNFKPGDRLLSGMLFEFTEEGLASGWGGFCDYTLANDHDAMIADGVADNEHGWFECHEIQNVIPADIPAEETALMCTWREVLSAITLFNITTDDHVLIYGGGPVGMSFVKLGHLCGWKWIGLVDRHDWKRQKALDLGANAVFAPGDPRIAAHGKYSTIVDAVGSPQIINEAIGMIEMEGKICIYGVLSDNVFSLDKSAAPYNFNLLFHQWPTRRLEREAAGPLIDWIRNKKLSAHEFVTHRYPLEQINEALTAIKAGNALKCLIYF